MKIQIKELLLKLHKKNTLNREELIAVLDDIDAEGKELLFELAGRARASHYGESVFLRGIVEFSNFCKNSCKYCGLRRANSKVSRYRLSLQQVMDCCKKGYKMGYRTFVLQSGEDLYYDDDMLMESARMIKSSFPDAALTFSVGERSKESYIKLKKAGVDRYLLRHETINPELYKNLHPGMSLENRVGCLYALKESGYQAGAGFITGLPGQDNNTLADDMLFLKRLKPHMAGIGPFIAQPDTPLGNEKDGGIEKTLVCLALTRLLLPDVLLPATTALAVIDKDGWTKGLMAGANVIMANLTPHSERGKYEIYRNRASAGDDVEECTDRIRKCVSNAGLKMCVCRGDHAGFVKETG